MDRRSMRRRFLWPALAVAGIVLSGAAPADEVLRLKLRKDVLLDHAHVVLADLADVDAGDRGLQTALEQLAVGTAPRIAYVEKLSRAELDALIHRRFFSIKEKIEWSGADSVQIRTLSRSIKAGLLADVAVQAVNDALLVKYPTLQLQAAASQPDVEVPAGKVQFKVRALDQIRLRSRMAVWVDVIVDGAPYRAVVIALQARAPQTIYVARRNLAPGSLAAPAEFERRIDDAADLQDEAVQVDEAVPAPRLRRALAQGQILTRPLLAGADMVLRGDRVRLVVEGNGIRVDAQALAQADAALGEMVGVKFGQGSDVVAARVVAQGVVQIDGKR